MRKKILLAFVALLFVFVSVSYAASTEIRAQLNNGLKFVLNGKAWTPPSAPISYKGTTYLPVRAVAEATGSKVGYNSATS